MARQPLQTTHQPNEVKTTLEAEEAASRSSVTEAVQKPIRPAKSWWSNASLWSKSENSAVKSSSGPPPQIEATKTSRDTEEQNT